MKEEIELFLQNKDELTEKLKIWVKDKSIPLDERWDLFIKSDLGEHSRYVERFNCKLGDHFVENLENKYETNNVSEILDFANYDPEDDSYSEEDIIEFKENVLDKFIKSFEFDW